MARRRRRTYTRRYYPRRKRTYRRRSSRKLTSKPFVKNIIDGVIASAVAKFIPANIPFARSIPYGAVGYFRKNTVMQTLSGISIGEDIGAMVLSGLKIGGGNGGFEGWL